MELKFAKKNIQILEIGFGTGLNLILTYMNSLQHIEYHAIEPYPLPTEIIKKIDLQNAFKHCPSATFEFF